MNPHGEIKIVRESATTALLDGGLNLGIVAMHKATEIAMDKARDHDLGMVVVRNSAHTGRMGEYVVRAAENGFMGLVFGTGAMPGGTVAPYLGISPRFNSNPIAWGVPAGHHPPVFFDFATSAAAVAKLMLAQDKGQPIPAGWLVGPDGKPTTDPGDWQRGGALLPFGGHKGYGFLFLIELLSGGLVGHELRSAGRLPAELLRGGHGGQHRRLPAPGAVPRHGGPAGRGDQGSAQGARGGGDPGAGRDGVEDARDAQPRGPRPAGQSPGSASSMPAPGTG